MMQHRRRRAGRARIVQRESSTIYNILECGFYGSLCYAILGPAVGLTAGFVGAGLLAVLAAMCVVFHGARVTEVYRPIVIPLLCGISFITLQLVIHGESLLNDYVRGFVTWILMLVVVQALSQRLEFLHRFTFVAFTIGLLLLPFLQISGDPLEYGRASLDQTVGLNNSNEFGSWFGFCAVNFLIMGMESRRTIARMVMWLAVVGCLYVVGLTISRGALSATVVASVVAARRQLKRGFVPVLFLVIVAGVVYNLGLFDRIVASYEARATQETGRMLVWPIVINRFLNAPLAGVGVSHITTFVPAKQREISPHNAFLFIALASGVIPMTLFIVYWWRAAQAALSVSTMACSIAPFALPLFLYCFMIINTSNFPIASACVLVPLSVVGTADDSMKMLRSQRRQQLGRGRRLTARLSVRQEFAGELQGSLARPPAR